MIIESLVASIIGGAVVWGLSEISHRRRSSEGHRTAAGQVLAALAEVRYRLSGTDVLFEVLASLGANLPAAERGKVKSLISGMIPVTTNLHAKVEEALHFIAGSNPGLAFRLRSRDKIESLLSGLREVLQSYIENPDDLPIADWLQNLLTAEAVSDLDEVILELAKLHGKRTLKDFRKRVARWNDKAAMKQEIEKELMEKLGRLAERIRSQGQAATTLTDH